MPHGLSTESNHVKFHLNLNKFKKLYKVGFEILMEDFKQSSKCF